MAPANREVLTRRCDRVRDRMRALDLDALLITHLANVFYLTGLRATAAAVILDADSVSLITDGRYITVASELAGSEASPSGLDIVRVESSYDETIRDRLRRLGRIRLGLESEHVHVKRWQWLRGSLGGAVELVPTDGLVEGERVVKDSGEQACLRDAGRLLAEMVTSATGFVRVDRGEREIAADIERELIRVGFEDRAFETIVAAGPRSALPHARPGLDRLCEGDLVLLDFGGVYGGYCVDLSRTVCVGRPSDDAVTLHAAVLAAQSAAIASVRPGVLASDVDAAARQVLEGRGFGEAFSHGTGHGLGIEVHEAPRLAPAKQLQRSGIDTQLEPGMVCTIEPGAYIPGLGGVRIEDDVLVTVDGCELLTEASRELVVL